MRSWSRALWYGFLVWLIPFAFSFLIFPLKATHVEFFKATMAVTVTVVGMAFAVSYFRRVDKLYVREGLLLGIIWFFMNVTIDLLLFMWGPMKMPFTSYMLNIGLTYLIYPVVTVGMGVLLTRRVV